jgi:ribosomal protein L29
MKRKELQEYTAKPMAELEKELADFHEKMNGLRLDVATGKVKSLKEFKHIKKSIAQIETIVVARKKAEEK